jgi:hypothetical protein
MVHFDVHSSMVRFSDRLEHKNIIVEEKFGPSAKKTAFLKEADQKETNFFNLYQCQNMYYFHCLSAFIRKK